METIAGQPSGESVSRGEFDEAEDNIIDKYLRDLAKRIGKGALSKHGFVIERASGNSDSMTTPENTSKKPAKLTISDFFDSDELLPADDGAVEQIDEMESSERSRKIEEAMRQLMDENVRDAGRRYFRLKSELNEDELMLMLAVSEAGSGAVSSRSDITDRLRDKIDGCRDSLDELATESPESFVVVNGFKFRGHIKEIHDGGIVTTPYVAEHMERLEENMREGYPTFIHGHLGSGKTELAIATAKRVAIEKYALAEAREKYGDYIAENPDLPKEDRRKVFGQFYRQSVFKAEWGLKQGDSVATEKFLPLIISGSKDLSSQDLYVDKTLKLTKFNGKPLLEHKEDLDRLIREWQESHPEEAKDPEKARAGAKQILELYKLEHQAFGTEVDTIEQALYRGVKEGRPVIIDEVNAIPTAVLISLNDILQRRPGQTCYIPGVGPVTIAEGFSVTMTGNLSSGNTTYGGTDELNPAFLSRLDVMEHDYLPMSETDGGYERQTDPRRNELFQVMIAYLADRQGNLELPEMNISLEKIFRMCQFAHATQLVFEGKWAESNVLKTESGYEMKPSLEKSVLSLRNLLNVLKDWDKGSKKDLDKALWDSFISNATNSDDQNMLLSMAKQFGFFSASDGWNVRIKERGAGFTSLDEIHPGEFDFRRSPMEVCDLRRVVKILYGEGPERTVYPDINFDELEELEDDELTTEDFEKLNETLGEVDKAIQALGVLGEQCGCPAEGTDYAE